MHKLYVLNDQDPFEIPLAQIVAGDAERAGITVAGNDALDMSGATLFTGEVEKIAESGAQAVFFAGGGGPATVALWNELHEAVPGLLLLGSSTLVNESFTSQLGAAGTQHLPDDPGAAQPACTLPRPRTCSPTTAVTSAGKPGLMRCSDTRR